VTHHVELHQSQQRFQEIYIDSVAAMLRITGFDLHSSNVDDVDTLAISFPSNYESIDFRVLVSGELGYLHNSAFVGSAYSYIPLVPPGYIYIYIAG